MVPKFVGNVGSVESCQAKAVALNMDTFSLQYGGECYVGNSPNYSKLGLETNKANCGPLGGTWSN